MNKNIIIVLSLCLAASIFININTYYHLTNNIKKGIQKQEQLKIQLYEKDKQILKMGERTQKSFANFKKAKKMSVEIGWLGCKTGMSLDDIYKKLEKNQK